jgi:hypothetical protein
MNIDKYAKILKKCIVIFSQDDFQQLSYLSLSIFMETLL